MSSKDKAQLQILFERTPARMVTRIFIWTILFKISFAYGAEHDLVSIGLLPTRQMAICSSGGEWRQVPGTGGFETRPYNIGKAMGNDGGTK